MGLGVIEDFVAEYERQFDFWEASARTARGLLEVELASSGLRAIVTSRAKSVNRLLEKLKRRNIDAQYNSVSAIREDIADLSGVRVALYFPGQMEEAEQIIRATLDVRHEKAFPMPAGSSGVSTSSGSTRSQRFSGYAARHFRAHIPRSRLNAEQERFGTALIEVQVASVLMHAWSEVEHDLVYKPLEGDLSPSEYALLDQLNGLVLAGEIALEQLQQAGDLRVAAAETPFRDHYELAESLRVRLSKLGVHLTEATLGRVDVLFRFLSEQQSATVSATEPYLELLEKDFEARPVADQLADLMLSGDEARYKAYSRAMSASRASSEFRDMTIADVERESPEKLALGGFIVAWVLFETKLKQLFESGEAKLPPLSSLFRRLASEGLISMDQFDELNRMRELRNRVVHHRAGKDSPERLREATAWLRELTREIKRP